jgi:hypothetical protein
MVVWLVGGWLVRLFRPRVKMTTMPIQLLLVKSGSYLIYAGIVMLAWELLIERFGFARTIRSELSGWKAKIRTVYAGLIVIAIGAALEVIAALAVKN